MSLATKKAYAHGRIMLVSGRGNRKQLQIDVVANKRMEKPIKIDIDPEFQNLIPRLEEHELNDLETSLGLEGCRDPLVLWNGWNLRPFQRAELALKLEPLIAAQAKEKQRQAGGAVVQRVCTAACADS